MSTIEEQIGQDPFTVLVRGERTKQHLTIAPALAAMILERVRPGGNKPEGGGGRKKPEWRPAANLTAVNDADDLWALMVNWATFFARELHLVPPGVAALHMGLDRDAIRLPHGVSAAIKVGMVQEVADWLQARQTDVEGMPGITEWESDLDSNMRTWLARYPLEITEPTLPRPCPECRRWAVRVAWSDVEGRYEDYRAECGACGMVVAATGVMAQHDIEEEQ